MAYYKDITFIDYDDGSAFDEIYNPGDETPYSGIYRCEVCGLEATSEEGNPLPPASHHAHKPNKITWRLVVAAKHDVS